MLPQSHVAYTWLALSLAQEHLDVAPDTDYRMVALAAMGSDLIDKPLAAAYFYRRYKSAVLFAHTLIAYALVALATLWRAPRGWVYGAAFVGHGVLDRIWHFHDTFYWPLRGWRFHVWGKRGSEQEKIGLAYWYAFTRRPSQCPATPWAAQPSDARRVHPCPWRSRRFAPGHAARRSWRVRTTGTPPIAPEAPPSRSRAPWWT